MRDVEYAVEIDRHDVLPVLDDGIRIAGEGIAPVDAGVVDEDRHLADIACDLRGGGAAGLAVRHVEFEMVRLTAGLADVGGRRGGRVAIDVERDDLRAFARISKSDGTADAGTRACDDSDVILQKPGHCSLR